jgi:2-dehydro-3-deoxy-D-arabinonate dehydratase
MALWKIWTAAGQRLARGRVDEGPTELLAPEVAIDELLTGPADALGSALANGTGEPVPPDARVLAPLGSQEIWAAGVTYRKSRDARVEESSEPEHYNLVYNADRPELFFKASAMRVRGPGDMIGVRSDSTWDVPEAELGLVVGSDARIVGYVVGNDVSSRSIEGENPLYLPQAKSYTGSCAIGPCLVPLDEAPPVGDLRIELEIRRTGEPVYSAHVPVSEMHRDPDELVDWLFRAMEFPAGVILLTGTALIPPAQFTLKADDEVTVTIPGIGHLTNPVEVVGRNGARRPAVESSA